MSFLLLILLPLAAIAVAGVTLLVASVRGKLVPGTTFCRACGFDLSGLKSAPSCPECGASLTAPRAIIPRRIRSKPRLWLGIVFTAIPLCIIVGMLAISVSNLNFQDYKPIWLLQTEAELGAPTRTSTALAELSKRIRTNSISEEQFAFLAATAIRLRRTPSTVWNRGWSDIIELGRANGKVSDSEWTDYVRYSTVAMDQHRKTLRVDTYTPFNIAIAGPQLGNATPRSAQARIEHGLIRATLDGNELFKGTHLGSITTITSMGTSSSGRRLKFSAPLGKARLNLTCRFVVLDPANDKELGSWEQDFTSDVEVLPSDTVLVEARENPSLIPAIRQSLKRQPMSRDADGNVFLTINAGRPPANLAFAVLCRLRSGTHVGQLIPLGKMSFRQGTDSGYGASSNDDALNVDAVDLIFRPSVSAAEENIDFDWFWTGPDIIFEDVKIEHKKR